MADSINWSNMVGHKVVVRAQQDGRFLFESKVVEQNNKFHTISIALNNRSVIGNASRFSLDIFAPEHIIEYNGTLRKGAVINAIELAVYGGREKDYRTSSRYDLAGHGNVIAVGYGEQIVKLHKPLEVLVENISANGVLIVSQPSVFFKKSIVKLSLKGDEFSAILKCEVVRIKDRSISSTEYGCKLLENDKADEEALPEEEQDDNQSEGEEVASNE